jgi:hypothetical protein
MYEQVRRGSARRRAYEHALAHLRTISYPVAALLGATVGALVNLGNHLERLLPSLNPQPPAWQGIGPDLRFMIVSGALVAPLALLLKRAIARWYLRARFHVRAP